MHQDNKFATVLPETDLRRDLPTARTPMSWLSSFVGNTARPIIA